MGTLSCSVMSVPLVRGFSPTNPSRPFGPGFPPRPLPKGLPRRGVDPVFPTGPPVFYFPPCCLPLCRTRFRFCPVWRTCKPLFSLLLPLLFRRCRRYSRRLHRPRRHRPRRWCTIRVCVSERTRGVRAVSVIVLGVNNSQVGPGPQPSREIRRIVGIPPSLSREGKISTRLSPTPVNS